ncbi:eCIS core domain-containing protein [Ulvibacter litoralis]|uniref:eCIS core domain-containing protein n=1 Tax=Ulvibacter litoralis TaxID=227084 RepID=A0A1G7HHJ0_9FLAO|nr:DUF4157 domain-containing protein [Ulvibacter litoralis]GHC57857.1 hypothetical protein GCM10008083_23110 [Ulvibacter litoralis]SDE99977.1 protein of unknown function [Ulvibacter litoralis]
MRAFAKNNGLTAVANASKSTGSNPFFGVQTKLSVGKSGDAYEQEADRVADSVVEKSNQQNSFFSTHNYFPPTSNPTVQKASEEDIQKQENSEELQEKPLSDTITPLVQRVSEEEESIQTKGGTNTIPPSLESNLASSKGSGNPLPATTKSQMESSFGTDFSHVRIHNDSNAVQMSKQLGAQAFANGNDIYFNEGKYNPSSKEGQHLLAHELTHTVQQGASVQRKLIQKAAAIPPTTTAETTPDEIAAPTNEFTDPDKGTINTSSKTISIPSLPVPTFKHAIDPTPTAKIEIPPGGFPRNNTHITAWETAAMEGQSTFNTRFTDYAASSDAPALKDGQQQQLFYLTLKGGSRAQRRNSGHSGDGDSGVIFGSLGAIHRRTSRPYWTKNGAFHPYDVDHKKELQIGGSEDSVSNMWMLDATANRSSGSYIRASRERKVTELLTASAGQLVSPPASYTAVKNEYRITFENGVVPDNSMTVENFTEKWDLDQIKNGEHLDGLKFLTESEVEAAGLRGSPDNLVLFTGLTGGLPINIPWDEEARAAGRKDGLSIRIGKRGGAMLYINSIIYNSISGAENQGGNGRILCTAFPGSTGVISEKTNLSFDIRPIEGVSYGGYIERASVQQAFVNALFFNYMSPITITEVGLDDEIGFRALGIISPSVPLIGNAGIELVIDEQGARFRKVFEKSDYNFPAPFEISNSALEVFCGSEGFGIDGEMNFKINHVGDGFLRGNFSTDRGFALAGGFNFDTELFDPASIEVSYEEEVLTVTGTIGIPEGKLQGVKTASITATYAENTFTAAGEAELDVPGIQRGAMTATYTEEGFSIGGDFQLKDDIPGIRGGSVAATISKQNGEEAYSIFVSGTAQPDIPGIDTALSVTYENGALTIAGTADYSRGMLSGSVNIGATNRTIGEDGEPNGAPDGIMRVYGGGSLTLTFTPWLQATAGVQFLPNGEIEVTGRIALPSAVDVFNRKSIDRNLFSMPAIEIPIFAIPLGPRSIGLVARITGGLDFSAGFGPGQLRDLYADVTYNPDREEETTISGHGEFAIPADAGLTLRGDLGLGVSIGIASLTGGIEIAGELGLEGEAAAEVDVNWSPQMGLAIDATGRITVQPKFTFDVNAFARASLDLWLFSISETWRYNLASFSWGPDIQFGIVFPIHYREGEPFDMSFDDIEVLYPELNIGNMITGLAKDVKNDIF